MAFLLLCALRVLDVFAAPGPAVASGAVAATEAVVESSDARLAQELDNQHWQDAPIYLVVVTNSIAEPISLEGIEPLMNLFQKLARLDLFTRELDLRLHLSGWNLSNGVPMPAKVDSAGILRATEAGTERTIEFDYSGLRQREPIRVRCGDPVDFTVLFSTNNLPPGKAQAFKPFRLMVVNGSKAPEALPLSRHLLNPNATRWPDTLRPALRKRLEQFHFLGGATNWQLRPFVRTTEASASYLYEGWRPQDTPPFGAELDFAAVKQRLEKGRTDLNNKLNDSIFSPAYNPGTRFNKEAQTIGSAAIRRQPGETSAAFSKRLEAARQQQTEYKLQQAPRQRWEPAPIQEQLDPGKAKLREEIRKLEQRLAAVPDSVDHAAYVSLFAVGPNVRMEVIRFSDNSRGDPP